MWKDILDTKVDFEVPELFKSDWRHPSKVHAKGLQVTSRQSKRQLKMDHTEYHWRREPSCGD